MAKLESVLLVICIFLLIGTIGASLATRNQNTINDSSGEIEMLEKQVRDLQKENEKLKEINNSLNIRVESLRGQVENYQKTVSVLATSKVQEEINETYAISIAQETLNNYVALPTICGVNNPVLEYIDYDGSKVERKEFGYLVLIPTVISGKNYKLLAEIDSYGEVKNWEWVQ